MVRLLRVISFVRASRPVTKGPTRRRSEGRSLWERVTREWRSVAGLWKSAKRLWPSHVAQMGVYFLLIEESYGVRPPYGYVVLGTGKWHRVENDAKLKAWVLELADRIRQAPSASTWACVAIPCPTANS